MMADNIRRHIALTERLIAMKKRQLPELREKLMWALVDEITKEQKEKFLKLFGARLSTAKDRDTAVKECIDLLERTVASNKKKMVTEAVKVELT